MFRRVGVILRLNIVVSICILGFCLSIKVHAGRTVECSFYNMLSMINKISDAVKQKIDNLLIRKRCDNLKMYFKDEKTDFYSFIEFDDDGAVAFWFEEKYAHCIADSTENKVFICVTTRSDSGMTMSAFGHKYVSIDQRNILRFKFSELNDHVIEVIVMILHSILYDARSPEPIEWVDGFPLMSID